MKKLLFIIICLSFLPSCADERQQKYIDAWKKQYALEKQKVHEKQEEEERKKKEEEEREEKERKEREAYEKTPQGRKEKAEREKEEKERLYLLEVKGAYMSSYRDYSHEECGNYFRVSRSYGRPQVKGVVIIENRLSKTKDIACVELIGFTIDDNMPYYMEDAYVWGFRSDDEVYERALGLCRNNSNGIEKTCIPVINQIPEKYLKKYFKIDKKTNKWEPI